MERFDLVMPAAPRATATAQDALAVPHADGVRNAARLPADPDLAQHAVLASVQERRSGAALVRSSAVLATVLSIGFMSALLQTHDAPLHSAMVAAVVTDGSAAALAAGDDAEPARPPMYQGEPAVY